MFLQPTALHELRGERAGAGPGAGEATPECGGGAGSTSCARRCGAVTRQTTRNPPAGLPRDSHRAGVAAAGTASAATVLGLSVPAGATATGPRSYPRCFQTQLEGVDDHVRVHHGDELLTQVARTTTKPIARFNARKPEGPRLSANVAPKEIV